MRFRAKHGPGLDPGVEAGSRQENASKQRYGYQNKPAKRSKFRVSLVAHASRRSLLSMRLLCFNKLDLILGRPPTGRANARPMTGSAAVSKDGPQHRLVIPGALFAYI